ncbi:MAG TPA: VOC family protein [Burkholderiales bacterium]|nr:VOC family protein [Burkholderiales bacterium]
MTSILYQRESPMPNPIVHFEIPADDVARAKAFYEKVFGWSIKQFPMPPGGPEYWGVTTRKKGEDGIDGGLMKRNMPGQPFANYVSVKSIEEFQNRIQGNGGTIIMPKQEIGPGMGWIAVFKDTEGNMMGLHQAPATMPKKAAAKKPAAKKTAAK